MSIISFPKKKNPKDTYTQGKRGAKESFCSDNVLIEISPLEYIHVIVCIIITNKYINKHMVGLLPQHSK